jgi:hypothetical protein
MNLQKKIIRLVSAACILWLIPLGLHAQAKNQTSEIAPTGQSKIVFETMTHDFGTVQPMTPLKHSFVFKNQGTDALLIEKVKAG